MNDGHKDGRTGLAIAMVRALRPALPAVIGAAALTFLFAAVMPLAWVTGISWNLYLDRLSRLFEPPVGNGGRLALALGMAVVAALIAGLIALALAKPDADRARMRRVREGDADDALLPRRRADFHPDDPPRPPIRAGRDLPAEGLGPLGAAPASADGRADHARELVLADLAPGEPTAGEEPWLQPAEIAAPPAPDPADRSLGALVARLEAGLARRRYDTATPAPDAPAPDAPAPDAGGEAPPPAVAASETHDEGADFALAAALGTLQRMNRQTAG